MQRKSFVTELPWSSYAFEVLGWPRVATRLGGGTLRMCEDVEAHGLLGDLDRNAGIDAFQQMNRAGAMRPIASRVQRDGTHEEYLSHTVRYRLGARPEAPTEYQKRALACADRDAGIAMPALTSQMYVAPFPDGEYPTTALRVGVVKTQELYGYLVPRVDAYRRRNSGRDLCVGDRCTEFRVHANQGDGGDGNVFLAVFWGPMRAAGVTLVYWDVKHATLHDVAPEPRVADPHPDLSRPPGETALQAYEQAIATPWVQQATADIHSEAARVTGRAALDVPTGNLPGVHYPRAPWERGGDR
jgi:hypothetical protein